MGKMLYRGLAAASVVGLVSTVWRGTKARGRQGLYARTFLPLSADLLMRGRVKDPKFESSQWLSGATGGELIRAAQVRLLGLNSNMNRASAWRIDYSTQTAQGRHLTATGTVIRSENPWEGTGPRPVIAFAPATQGTAPQCDPSYSMQVFFDVRRPFDIISAYEQPAVNMFVAAGCHVVLTDYPREPETGRQLYCNHTAGSHALYDAVRAAKHLGVSSERIGLFGFSQGGGCVAAMLEEPEYAPDVAAAAAVCGAPPSDFEDILEHVDGKTATFVLPYALDGMMASHPDLENEVAAHMTKEATELLEFARAKCVLGAMPFTARQDTTTMTSDGRSLVDVVRDLPLTFALLDDMRLGSRAPQIPTRLWATAHDDIIPHHSTQKLADVWGIPLLTRRLFPLLRFDVANHLAPFFLWMHTDINWLIDQLEATDR